MERRTFLKKAALAAVGTAAYASSLSATLTNSDTRMKVLLINGSPRPDGNTFCALQEIEAQLKKQGIETGSRRITGKAPAGGFPLPPCEPGGRDSL